MIMNILILIFSLSLLHAADPVVRNLDIGRDEIDKANYIIKVTGDYPMYEVSLTGGKDPVDSAMSYMGLVAYDVCAEQGDFVPRQLGDSISEKDKIVYKVDFKCELRDKSDWVSMIQDKCTNSNNKFYKKLCGILESRHGKDLVTQKNSSQKYTVPWF